MNSQVTVSELESILLRQLQSFFPISEEERRMLSEALPLALARCETCFSRVSNKYYSRDGQTYFSPYHSGQWLTLLYFMANTLSVSLTFVNKWGGVNTIMADKLYYLNKIMHSVDIYHEVRLPEVFFFEHPVGTVLGRAVYEDGFMAYQNCTVGGNKGSYPVLGKNFHMMSGSKILGKSCVGDNVILAADTYVKDTDIPSGCIVFGQSPNLIFKIRKDV